MSRPGSFTIPINVMFRGFGNLRFYTWLTILPAATLSSVSIRRFTDLFAPSLPASSMPASVQAMYGGRFGTGCCFAAWHLGCTVPFRLCILLSPIFTPDLRTWHTRGWASKQIEDLAPHQEALFESCVYLEARIAQAVAVAR